MLKYAMMLPAARAARGAMTASALGAIGLGCSGVTEVSTLELEGVVARDGVPFAGQAIPAEFLDRLSLYRVVVVGETHLLVEHRELMAALVQQLHTRGFRQLLLEWPHMVDWLFHDFVNDRELEPDWIPNEFLGGALITAIRDFNRSLPEGEHVQVRAIDVNLDDYGGAATFVEAIQAVSRHLPDPGPIAEFLAGSYGMPESQADRIQRLRDELGALRSDLSASWGSYWYDTVVEMVEVESASVSIRAMRDDHYDLSVRLREDVMKRLADLRLKGFAHGTLLNVGGHHAQKSYLLGTSQEWLGDYLAHASPEADGSVIALFVTAARIESPAGAKLYDIRDASPANELFRLMNENWPEHTVYLPLDDPVFSEGGVAVNFEEKIRVCALKEQYDVVVVMPLAHRVQAQ